MIRARTATVEDRPAISHHRPPERQDHDWHPGPDEVIEAPGSGKRPAVKVTVNGYTCQRRIAKSVAALKQGRAR